MPGSIASLDSLSSPSPSPPPQQDAHLGPGATSAGLDSGSELSELTEDEQEPDNRNSMPTQGDGDDGDEDDEDNVRRRAPRRGGRKRRGMVPAPMWDWAYKGKKTDENGTPGVEEEEEEEMSGPPRAMEEEEDEDEERDSAAQSLNGNPVEDEDDVEDVEDPRRVLSTERQNTRARPVADDEPSASEDDEPDKSLTQNLRKRRSLLPSQSAEKDDLDNAYRSGDDDVEEEQEEVGASSGQRRRTLTNGGDNEAELPDDDENDTESEDENLPIPDGMDQDADMPLGPPGAAALKTAATLVSLAVDVTAPSPAAVAPIAAAAAASSIMAGSAVLDPPSPSSSSSSASPSPSPSRSPSPAPEQPPPLTNGKRKREGRKKASAINGDVDASTHLEGTSKVTNLGADAEQDGIGDDVEPEELEAEQDIDLELDLQPAHRAEALDVLATIELKFALLREKVYVEKMEGLAWEEALVGEGTHPEMIHLQAELSKRRDKRLDLACRKRMYEVASVTKRRRLEEDAVWSWWKLARDELQTDMISETNRKRRRLERERRAIERPQPVRRIPNPIRDAPLPPSLREIADTVLFANDYRSNSKKRDFATLAYPDLGTLATADIAGDLEFLYQHRRAAFDPQRIPNLNAGINLMHPQVGPAAPYDAYQMNGASVMESVSSGGPYGALPPDTRMPPPPPPMFQHQHTPLSGPQGHSYPLGGGSSGGRSQLHAPGMTNPSQSQFVDGPGIGPGLPHPQAPPQFIGTGVGGSHNHSFVNAGMSRPITPVHITGNGMAGPAMAGGPSKPGPGWSGPGRGPGVQAEPKSSGGMDWNDGRRRELRTAEEEREREMMRDRDREKEKARERDYLRDQHEIERDHERERGHTGALAPPQGNHRHTSSHQHSHPHLPAPPHHHIGQHHHHRHHHHVLHHHHPQQSQSGGGSGGHSSSAPMPGYAGMASPNMPRRDLEYPRPGPSHSLEIINLSKPSQSGSLPPHWKRDEFSDHREPRSKHNSRPSSTHPPYDERERPLATSFVLAPSHGMSMPTSTSAPASLSGYPMSSGGSLAPSPRPSWSHAEDGTHPPPSTSSAFPGPGERFSSPGPHRYPGSSGPTPRPSQASVSRQNSTGVSPPRVRHPPSPSSLPFTNPLRSPSRFTQPGSVVPPLSADQPPRIASATASPILKPRRPLSPSALPSSKLIMPVSGYPPPRLTGPGQTAAPPPVENGSAMSVHSSRTAPLPPYSSPSLHPNQPPPTRSLQGTGVSMPPPKMTAIQMTVDGP
ncbi:hypothetical protein BV22DRAFT_1133862 [Leucogyrophana mollusca]|uniref:Uncharacterized protein n=1 Tax=Leucogyrophana mollusca TaxID=85980 RepID=A0ACB8B2F2_9AGAM|nr:hypothetical protein BV22DRAFT_1133862 [Leucogyrophana mollusca]